MTLTSFNYRRSKELLLHWFDHHGRNLPWRVKGKAHPYPYHVWLSEIMLQQTTVATVKGYFKRFIERWPTLTDFATASLDEVLHQWQGLGYYARARHLHRCAQHLVTRHHSLFPVAYDDLLALPGVGPYTAAAIAAIAFDQPVVPIDGNVIRVLSRLFAIEESLPASLPLIKTQADQLASPHRSSDFAQALMDLGATVCTPRQPRCLICPWQTHCQAYAQGLTEVLPRKAPKVVRPTRYGVAFLLSNTHDELFLRQRPPKGLLGGMVEVPSTDWRTRPWTQQEAQAMVPLPCHWAENQPQPRVVHTFTHFHLELEVLFGWVMTDASFGKETGFWVAVNQLDQQALPTLMKKILKTRLLN